MQYAVSQLVDKAKSLADIQNSNFISWRENIDYINDSFINIYNNIIQSGDPAFLKQYTLGSDNSLPSDFYQLQSVKTSKGLIVLRHVDSDPIKTLSYQVTGNQILIYGNPTDSIIIRYYPQPATLTYPAETRDYPVNSGYSFACAEKNIVVQVKSTGTGENIVVHFITTNIDTGDVYTYDSAVLTSIVPTRFVIKNGYIYFQLYTSAGIWQLGCVNYVTSTYTSIVTSSNQYKLYNGNDGYIWANNGTSLTFLKLQGTTKTNAAYTPSTSTQQIFMMNDSRVVYDSSVPSLNYYDSDGTETANFLSLTDTQLADIQNLWVRGGYIIIMYSGETIVYTGLSGSFVIDSFFGVLRAVDVTEVNEKTGYGIAVYNNDSWLNQLISFLPDTLLDFPAQLYFQLLSYQLAIAYKMKQGADTSAIETQLDDAWSTFYDTLKRDANLDVRIKNVM